MLMLKSVLSIAFDEDEADEKADGGDDDACYCAAGQWR
jgi:hypothetical protein